MSSQHMSQVLGALRGKRFPLEAEKATQAAIADTLDQRLDSWAREVRVAGGVIDFVALGDIGIEVKLKGQEREIERQLEAYASDPALAGLILVTARPVALPGRIGGKPVAVLDIARAWL